MAALFLDRKWSTTHRRSKTSSSRLPRSAIVSQIIADAIGIALYIQVSLLPARPRPINKDRFTRIFLSDAVTTEFPSPGDDRIQFHAVSLLEASIFTKAVSQQRVLATDAFRLLCSPPSISLGNSPAKARQQAHTQHTKKRIASRVCSECRIKLRFWVDLEVVDGGRRGICLMERGFKKERMAVQLSFVNVQTTTYNIIIELDVLIN